MIIKKIYKRPVSVTKNNQKSFEYEARESVRSPSNEFIALVTFFAFREDGMPKVQLVELMPARKILANVCLG